MKIIIFGATGPTGQELVKQGLDKGYEVTAFIRDPSKLKIKNKHLRIFIGDSTNEKLVHSAIKNQDVVLSALGTYNLKKSNFMYISMKNIVSAMRKEHKKRLIFMSGFGSGKTYKKTPLIIKIMLSFIKNIYIDKDHAETYLKKSNLDYTLIYATLLTHGPKTMKYTVSENMKTKPIPRISRADVAHFMLKQIKDRKYIRKSPILYY